MQPLRERAPRPARDLRVQPEPPHEPPQPELAKPLPRVDIAFGAGALVAVRCVAPVRHLRVQRVAFLAEPHELRLGVRAPQRHGDRIVQLGTNFLGAVEAWTRAGWVATPAPCVRVQLNRFNLPPHVILNRHRRRNPRGRIDERGRSSRQEQLRRGHRYGCRPGLR